MAGTRDGEDSEHFDAMGDTFATHEIALRRNHLYEESGRGRWIEELVSEIERTPSNKHLMRYLSSMRLSTR